ncbi:multidrug effflux MFS transporter [Salana multivorans]
MQQPRPCPSTPEGPDQPVEVSGVEEVVDAPLVESVTGEAAAVVVDEAVRDSAGETRPEAETRPEVERQPETEPTHPAGFAPGQWPGERPGVVPARPRAWLVGLLGAMSAIFAVTVDMYLPSLPQVAQEMRVSDATGQLTISFMMIGAAIGQLVVGPWSDRVGRRKPVLLGAALHVVACALVLLGSGIAVFLGLRLAQGVAAAALGVCAQALIRDRFSGPVAAATLSRLMLVIGVAPLFAPTVGGFIAHHWGWRTVFGVLAGCGLLVLVMCWRFLPESHPVGRRQEGGLPAALRSYKTLFGDPRFLALAVLPGLVSGALMSYVSGSPFVLQVQFGLSVAEFSVFFAVGGLLLVGMAQINAALVHRYAPVRIIRLALPVQLTLALGLVVVAVTGIGGVIGFLVMLALVISLQNFVPPNATALALSRHGGRAGAAAAVCGCLGALLPAIISPLVGVFGGSAIAMASVMAGSLVVGLLVVALGTPAYRRGGWTTGRD